MTMNSKNNGENTIESVYTIIYLRNDEQHWLNFLFYHSGTKAALFYDGMQIDLITVLQAVPPSFTEMNPVLSSKEIYVEDIRRKHSTSFIKFKNGDLLRTYFMGDEEDSLQNAKINKIDQPGYWQHLEDYEAAAQPKINRVENDTGVFD
jgi:hypothetical protein